MPCGGMWGVTCDVCISGCSLPITEKLCHPKIVRAGAHLHAGKDVHRCCFPTPCLLSWLAHIIFLRPARPPRAAWNSDELADVAIMDNCREIPSRVLVGFTDLPDRAFLSSSFRGEPTTSAPVSEPRHACQKPMVPSRPVHLVTSGILKPG